MSNDLSQINDFITLEEPLLAFHPVDKQKRHIHPLRGLSEHGPYSQLLFEGFEKIRIAFVFPDGYRGKAIGLFNELKNTFDPKERKNYLPKYEGFEKVFRLGIEYATKECHQIISSAEEEQLRKSEKPHLKLAEIMANTIRRMGTVRHAFDVAVIYLPMRWKNYFKVSTENEDFDLHDFIKVTGAQHAIPIQIISEGSFGQYFCRCSVMWRLSIALYCKTGGIPWKLATEDSDTAFIGISYAVKQHSQDQNRFITCCSQIFDGDGSGLEFLLYETECNNKLSRNPYLNRDDMRRILARSLALYQRRHAGRSPKRVIIHKTTEFKDAEIKGCFDAFQNININLIQIQDDVIWRGVKFGTAFDRQQNKTVLTPTPYPCDRGVALRWQSDEVLLWTQGDVSSISQNNASYFKEGKGIPSPLLLRFYAGCEDWQEQCEILHF